MYSRFILIGLVFLFTTLAYTQKLNKSITYYDKEAKQIKEKFYYNLKTKKLDSIYISYFPNGTVKSTGYYKLGEIVGEWVYNHENGNPKAKGIYKNNKQNGSWVYYHENGNLKMEGEMLDGKKNGFWKSYFESNILKSEGIYNLDKQDGFWNYYNEDGSNKGVAKLENGDGEYFEYFENGNIKVTGYIKNGVSDSIWTYYYENGKKKSEGFENNGQKNGEWKTFHKNGLISEIGTYKKGKPLGLWKYYHLNGTISAQGNHDEQGKDGKWSYYYDTGDLKGEIDFALGGNGEYKEYYNNGKLKAKGNLKNGKNEGHWEYYYETGELEGEAEYKNGSGLYIGFYNDGTKKMEGDVSNGQKMGTWSLYDEHGILKGIYKHLRNEDSTITQNDSSIETEKPDSAKNLDKVNKEKESTKPRTIGKGQKFVRPIIYKSFIVGSNPVAVTVNQLPFYLEYYIEKKMGLELQYNTIRFPFWSNHNKPLLDEEYQNGYSITFKEKFYKNPKVNKGMWYISYDLRYTHLDQNVYFYDSTSLNSEKIQLASRKTQSFEITAQFGDRFIKRLDKPGFTLDLFLGLGIGFKNTKNRYPGYLETTYNQKFKTKVSDGIYLPIRLGFNLGYLF